jgi:hypothetical protein
MATSNFICEMCETDLNPRSPMWEEMCIYCNEMCLEANLDNIRSAIKAHEIKIHESEAVFKPRLVAQLAKPEIWNN